MASLRFVLLSVALLAALALAAPAPAAAANTLSAYYPNWSQYRPSPYTYTPDNFTAVIPLLDHVYYAFAGFDTDSYTVTLLEPSDPQYIQQVVSDVAAAGNGGTVSLSVGGWNQPSSSFSSMANSTTNRAAFVKSLVALLQQYNLDGVDIDWEWPCSPPRVDWVEISTTYFKEIVDHGGDCNTDMAAYVMLVRDIRAAFTAACASDASDWCPTLITVVSPANPVNGMHFNFTGLDQYVDLFHITNYDYTVSDISNSTLTAPNAPLYPPTATGVSQLSTSTTLDWYLAQGGVDVSSLALGIAFYGHSWYLPGATTAEWQTFGGPSAIQGSCYGPFVSTYGAAPGPGSQLCGTLMYSEIGNTADLAMYYDNATESAIAYESSSGVWVSYTDQTSAAAMVQWGVKSGVTNYFLWDISMDSLTASGFTYELSTSVCTDLGLANCVAQ